MHFSIPDTQEFIDEAGNAYSGYNVHINGLFHCTVRYKQLHNLHEQLLKNFNVCLPSFPPKKFFPLTVNQQEERRLSLEKYIQTIGQNTVVNNTEILNGFLIYAQQETIGAFGNENLDVYLMNGTKISINISTGENSTQVLKKVCKKVQLSEELHSYFALFIVVKEDSINILRKLQDFESPFITHRNIHTIGAKIVVGKNYWDISYDFTLFDNAAALNLLFIQTVSEINRGWIKTTEELERRLTNLQNHDSKKEYMNVARSLKYYGYIQFTPCYCDYPEENSRVLVSIGRNELNLRVLSNGSETETIFKVSRMRCWRITTLQNNKSEDSDFNLELSFEYLVAKNKLQWITVSSEQAILMSVCLQSMIDELLSKSVECKKAQQVPGKSWIYMMRDGRRIIVNPTESLSQEKKVNDVDSLVKPEPIMKKLTEKLSTVKLKKSDEPEHLPQKMKKRCILQSDVMENNAFNTIGDEDL